MQYSRRYGTDEFRTQCQQLAGVDYYTVVPVLEKVIQRFVADAVRKPAEYGITDLGGLEKFGENGHRRNYLLRDKQIVVDGTLVEIGCDYADMLGGEDEFGYVAKGISFGGKKQAVDKIYDALSSFVGKQQDLDAMVAAEH